jgi:hypothetical protein
MEFGKYRRLAFRKYHTNINKYIEDIDQFNDLTSEYWDTCNNLLKINNDNKPTVRRWNKELNKFEFYAEHSKHWSMVDPTRVDERNIQHDSMCRVYMLFRNKITDQWEFPSLTLYNGDSFEMSKVKLFFHVTKENFKIYYPDNHPLFVLTREFYEHEKEDPKNKGLRGVRTFYYQAQHFRGAPMLTPNGKHPYDDFLLSSKFNMNNFLKKNYYDGVISALLEY